MVTRCPARVSCLTKLEPMLPVPITVMFMISPSIKVVLSDFIF